MLNLHKDMSLTAGMDAGGAQGGYHSLLNYLLLMNSGNPGGSNTMMKMAQVKLNGSQSTTQSHDSVKEYG